MEVNFGSAFRLRRVCIPDLSERRGCVVSTASVAAVSGYQRQAAYSAAKAELTDLTRNIAANYGRHGVGAHCVAPGIIRTALTEQRLSQPEFWNLIVGSTALERAGMPDDVAAAILS